MLECPGGKAEVNAVLESGPDRRGHGASRHAGTVAVHGAIARHTFSTFAQISEHRAAEVPGSHSNPATIVWLYHVYEQEIVQALSIHGSQTPSRSEQQRYGSP